MKFEIDMNRLLSGRLKRCPCKTMSLDNLCPCVKFCKTSKCVCGVFKKIDR